LVPEEAICNLGHPQELKVQFSLKLIVLIS
jgi:hypothetical protein